MFVWVSETKNYFYQLNKLDCAQPPESRFIKHNKSKQSVVKIFFNKFDAFNWLNTRRKEKKWTSSKSCSIHAVIDGVNRIHFISLALYNVYHTL